MKRTRFISGTILAVIFTLFVGPSTVQLFAQGGTWTTKTPMPTPRYWLSASGVNHVLYAVGGTDGLNYFGTVEAYDPASNAWTTKASMPTPRAYLSTSVVNGILYAVGGVTYGGVVGTVEAYDPASNTWTTKASLPTPRGYLSTCVVDGIIYAVGGWTGAFVNTVEAYNPASDTWTTKALMPAARYGLGTSVVNGIIHAVGGFDGASFMGTVEAYDPATDTWTTKASMPTGRPGLGSGVVNGIIYAVGGYGAGTGPLATLEAYDPASDTWTTKASMPTARLALGADVVNGVFYAVGGNSCFSSFSCTESVLGTVEAFTPSNTPLGSNISVQPTDSTTGGSPVNLTFSTVTQAGNTTLTTSSSGPTPPQGFKLGSPGTFYNLATTAVYSGAITICINYGAISFHNPSQLAIWHYDGGGVTKLATTINTDTATVCATTPSLSPFAIFEPAYAAQVQQPISSDGSSVFTVKRGVVPVKFTITYGGDATCQLPPATISLIRTAGAVLGSIDQSEFLQASDIGSNFRIDTASCQYVYNLGTSSLGTGTYQVNISIDGSVVGSGTFGLK